VSGIGIMPDVIFVYSDNDQTYVRLADELRKLLGPMTMKAGDE
jgi:hypothetical protein